MAYCMTYVSVIVSLSIAFGAYSNTRQALTQWGCARKLYAAVRVSMQCTCVKNKDGQACCHAQ